MRPQILSGIHRRKEAVSMCIPVSFPTQTANSRASLCLRRILFFSTTKSPVATPQKVTELINCPIILVVFISFFFQVSFSSYKPTNYTSDDSEDHVDGCVKPYFPVFTSVLFEDSVESVFHMSRKQHSSSRL